MVTPSGVGFEQGPGKRWKAVLPQGQYLPENLVVERGEQGLTAHLEAPLDESFVFPCSQNPDGTVVVTLDPDESSRVVFRPDSLDYGVQGWGHTEGYRANGNWFYDCSSTDGPTYHAERTPAGELTGSYRRGGRSVPMAVSQSSDRLIISPDRTPLRERIAEHGFFAGLKLAVECFTSGSLNTFFFQDGRQLFPKVARRADNLRQEMKASTKAVERLAAPPELGSGVKVTERSVSIGGVVLRRATRIDRSTD